ncbi:hypothetical protein BRAS3843_1480034 [Bradyrhizobium sp. STM 3843]|uniref:hypothetical protein n=1 Tax=Bradyrhizobium sp. STM 3843 TaxID=551947 RepID=UPI0002406BAD|nr:hypothetical protein [Bradyrhizobium sp. STM 3843]CCE05803.1 hypothetical protein BRAS3843_1480034 [Bradyrhizobium sp. STM 3843]
MPAIAEQVASIEHDLSEALAKIESLEAEKVALTKALAAVTAEKDDLEVRQSDMQLLVDDTREVTDKIANMALTMLRTSRRPVAGPASTAGDIASGGDRAATEPSGEIEAEVPLNPALTGRNDGMRRIIQEATASDRLRSRLLMETAVASIEARAPRGTLPEGMPMFLQETRMERRRERGHRGLA